MAQPSPSGWRDRFETVALALTAVVIGSRTLADADLWGHLRFGLDMVASGWLPRSDPYSFTSDVAWVNHEWLAEAIMGLSWTAGGPAGLVLLKTALLVATWVPVDRMVRVTAPRLRPALPLLLVIALWQATAHLRPQNFSFALFAWLLYLLQESRLQPRLLWWIPPMFALWANLHGGWLVGGLVVAFWAMAVFTERTVSRRTLWLLFLSATLSLLATLANPYGWHMWEFLGRTVRFSRDDIVEWHPVYRLGWVFALPWVACAAVAVAALRRGLARNRAAVVALLVLAGASIQVARLSPFFALATIAFTVPCFIQKSRLQERATLPRRQALAGMATCAVASLLALSWNAYCVSMTNRWLPDAETSRMVLELPPGRVLTHFNWGQYVIWHRGGELLVSMDGRRETVYSERVREAHRRFLRGEEGSTQYPDLIGADYVWIPARVPVVSHLMQSGWRVLARGETAVLLVRSADDRVSSAPRVTLAGHRCFPGP